MAKVALKRKEINILHLSDFHFLPENVTGEKKNLQNEVFEDLEKALNHFFTQDRDLKKWKPTFIVITGDIANTGETNEYKEAEKLFKSIIKITGVLPKNIIPVVGNHDKRLEFEDEYKFKDAIQNYLSKPSNSNRKEGTIEYDTHNEYIKDVFNNRTSNKNLNKFIEKHYIEFNRFCERMGFSKPINGLNNDYDYTHGIHYFDKENIAFAVFNSTLASISGYADYGKLELHADSISNTKKELLALKSKKEDITIISALHHPPSWLNENEIYSITNSISVFDEIIDLSNIILCGHVHNNRDAKPDILNYNAPLLMSGSGYKSSNKKNSYHFNSFNLIKVEPENETFSTRPVVYKHERPRDKKTYWELGKENIFPLLYGESLNRKLQDYNNLLEEIEKLRNENKFLLAQLYSDEKKI